MSASTVSGGREAMTVLIFVAAIVCVLMLQRPRDVPASDPLGLLSGDSSSPSSVPYSPSNSSSSSSSSKPAASAPSSLVPGPAAPSSLPSSGGYSEEIGSVTENPAFIAANGNGSKYNPNFYSEAAWKPRARYGWKQRLFTPTFVTQELGFWIIVSCWQHRILYRKRTANETDADLDYEKDFEKSWRSLPIGNASLLVIPHSIASNGNVIVAESSIGGSGVPGEHSILVWEPKDATLMRNSTAASPALAENEDWRLIQVVRACDPADAAVRPHRILYDEVVQAFFLYITHMPPDAAANLWKFRDTTSAAATLLLNQSGAATSSPSTTMAPPRNESGTDPTAANGTGAPSRRAPKGVPKHIIQCGSLSRFERIDEASNKLKLIFCKPLHFTYGAYSRSISMDRGELVVTVGPNAVTRFAHREVTNETVEVPVKARYFSSKWKTAQSQMNDVRFIDGWWYITQTSQCRFFRTTRLPSARWRPRDNKFEPKLETLHHQVKVCRGRVFGRTDMCTGGGTPYFLTKIGSRIYVPYIFHCSGILSFVPGTNSSHPVLDYKHHFHSMGWAETPEDIERRGPIW